MFTWNVEDMKLLNQECNTFIGKEKIYNCENEVLREEKLLLKIQSSEIP